MMQVVLKTWCSFFYTLLIVGLQIYSSLVHAQASVASEDIIDEVRVKVGRSIESFTVFRHFSRSSKDEGAGGTEQWYYLPSGPRLYIKEQNGKRLPEFHLIRYQFEDPDDAQKTQEGGILQFAVSLAVPPEALDQLKQAIAEKTGAESVRLSAMPLVDAKIHLYTPGEGKFVASAFGSGIAPVHATQKMAFSVDLTRSGADVYDSLVNGNTGMILVFEHTYQGVTPELGVKITVNWDATREFVSKNLKFAAEAKIWALGGSANYDSQSVIDTLTKNGAITMEYVVDETITKEQLDTIVQPLMDRINKEFLRDLPAPEEIAPAQAADVKLNKRSWWEKITNKKGFLAAGVSYAKKSVKDSVTGEQVYDFSIRQVIPRTSVTSSSIGIGGYPQSLKDEMVTVVPKGPWQSAFFLLPSVGDGDDIGLNQVDLEVSLVESRNVLQRRVASWTPTGGWKDKFGAERTMLNFPLMGEVAAGVSLKRAQFRSKAQITSRRKVTTVETTQDVFNGEAAVATPLSSVDIISVDGSFLSWSKVDPSSDLVAVSVTLKRGSESFSGKLAPKNINGEWQAPGGLVWLTPVSNDSVRPKITFLTNSGKKIEWEDNGRDLVSSNSSLDITLVDGFWRQQ